MSFIPESIYRNHDDHQDHHRNLFPTSSPHDFHGVPDFTMRRSMSFSVVDRGAEDYHPDDEGSDDGSQLMLGEKKRRLNLEQVKALEKSFDSGNKLEPERKMQLARALGLQPRQIAIWFQNRRARWKTKQLEKDYDVLKRQFDALKADNDALKSQNKNLRSQLLNMKSRDHNHSTPIINLNKDNEGSNWSNGSENSCDHEVNLNATESTAMLYHQNRHDESSKAGVVFNSPMNTAGPIATSLTHLIHSATGQDNHPRKINNVAGNSQTPVSNDQCFGNVMFGGIEENPEFWPWPEQQNFL